MTPETKQSCLDRAAREAGFDDFFHVRLRQSPKIMGILEKAMDYHALACLQRAAERAVKNAPSWKEVQGIRYYYTLEESITSSDNLI